MNRVLVCLLICAAGAFAQTKKIIVQGADAAMLKEYQSVTPKARVVGVTDANIMQEIADADAMIGNITPAEVRAGKNLKWVAVMSAGVENVLMKSGGNDLRDSNIILTNNKVVQGPEIADHALAMLLALSRDLPTYWAAKQNENWLRQPYKGIELMGKNALVIGVGGIGMQIATRAWAFGMNVTGVDPEDKPFTPMIKKIVKPDQIDDVIADADVVFISTPDTPRSHKMVGAKEFELMKRNSYFIAVSRGGIYDLPSLVKALDEKKLAGAGVDVVDPEPLPQGNALWKFPNVIITPHIAGRSDKDRGRMVGTIKENIERFV
ncbi:MAG: D-2-hydroxyacid dehydrogenase, partial [Acidobacteriaceae bacterium]|nr:D-2-hydroxyacid dehydrogenase [Acidobacteriaceae bacterium]